VEQISRHILFVILTCMVVGMITSCLFLCQGTADDVGMIGAFIVHLIFNLIFSLLISIGIILSIKSNRLLKIEYNLYANLTTSSIIIMIGKVNYIYSLYLDNWTKIIIFYIISTYFLAIFIGLLASSKKK